MHCPSAFTFILAIVCGALALPAAAEEPVIATGQFRLYGLFSPDRQDDLRLVMQKLPDVKLVSVDFDAGEATFEYDIKKAFGSPTPEQVPERLNNMLRGVSNGTFGVKPLCTTARDKLERLEIPVYGLDCKACSFACYKMLAEVDGVEYAIASFKEQKAVVLIDPAKTNRAALEKRLKEREVSLEPAKVIVVP
jgi:copper chaperone CopZ